MGLTRKEKKEELKKLEFKKQVLAFLEDEYGIKPIDLLQFKKTTEYVEWLKENKDTYNNNNFKPITMSEEQKKKTEEQQTMVLKPSDWVKMFEGEVEEFYPYGRVKEH